MTLPRCTDRFKQNQSFSKQRQFLFWTIVSTFANLSLVKRMNSFEKTLIKLLLITVAIIVFFWYAEIRINSVPKNVITINKETWKILEDRFHFADKIHVQHKQISSDPKKADAKPRSRKIFNSSAAKDEWMFEILKDSRNLQADPSAPRDSSYSIMKNGIREPLDETEPVVLVWWPPDYLNNKQENWLEREFQGVCGKCRLTTDRSTFYRSNAIVFDNIPMNSNLEDLPPQNSRYSILLQFRTTMLYYSSQYVLIALSIFISLV